jgi:hypothetical protein
MREMLIVLALTGWFSTSAEPAAQAGRSTTPPTALSQNIGKSACNANNGTYRGRIVDVVQFAGSGQSLTWVYVVERDGRRVNAPPDSTTVAARCPDGQPSQPTAAPVTPTAGKPVISPVLQSTATEFSRRLGSSQGSCFGSSTIRKRSLLSGHHKSATW